MNRQTKTRRTLSDLFPLRGNIYVEVEPEYAKMFTGDAHDMGISYITEEKIRKEKIAILTPAGGIEFLSGVISHIAYGASRGSKNNIISYTKFISGEFPFDMYRNKPFYKHREFSLFGYKVGLSVKKQRNVKKEV